MDLHSHRKPSATRKFVVGIGLLALFVLSLVSPRFWFFRAEREAETSSKRPPARVTRPPAVTSTPAAPQAPVTKVQPVTPPVTAEPAPLVQVGPPRDLPRGEVLLPLLSPRAIAAHTGNTTTKGAQPRPETIPGPRLFGASTQREPEIQQQSMPTVVPTLTIPNAAHAQPEASTQEPSQSAQPVSPVDDVASSDNTTNADTAHNLDGNRTNDPAGSRTELNANPAGLGNNSGEIKPLTREETIRANWPWMRPRRLTDYLDRLEDHAQCAMWADEVRWLIEETNSPADLAAALPEIRQQLTVAESLATELAQSPFAAQLRRAAYALERNLAIWEATANSMRVAAGDSTSVLSAADAQRLAQTLAAAEARLAGTPDRNAWRSYLRLDELTQLSRQLSETSQATLHQEGLALLDDVARRFAAGHLTPGQQAFLREGALADLHAQLLSLTSEPADRMALLTALEQYEYTGLPADAWVVAQELRVVKQSPVAEDRALANTLEGYYRNNNVRVVVSDELLTRMLPPQSDRIEATDDTILGVPIRGQSTTKTRLALRMAPGDSAALELLVMGDVDSFTQGESGPVRTYNQTNAQYIVHKKLVLDGHGIRALPGRVEVVADSRLQCLETDFDDVPLFGSVVRSFAEQQVEETKDEARREIEQRISAKVAARVDREADQGFARMNERLFRNLATVQRLGLEPAAWFQHPDDSRLAVHMRLAGAEQLAANTPRPRALSNSLASIQLHQSTLNNLLESLDFNGRTLTVEEAYVHVMEKLSLGMDFTSLEGGDSTITFAKENPITVTLDNGMVHIVLRVEEVSAQEGTWGAMNVHVNYRPAPAGAGYALYREGPLGLESRALRFRDTVLLRGVFSRVFQKDTPISILGHALRADPRFAGLGVTQFDVEDGWLGVSIGPALDRLVETPHDRQRTLDLRR